MKRLGLLLGVVFLLTVPVYAAEEGKPGPLSKPECFALLRDLSGLTGTLTIGKREVKVTRLTITQESTPSPIGGSQPAVTLHFQLHGPHESLADATQAGTRWYPALQGTTIIVYSRGGPSLFASMFSLNSCYRRQAEDSDTYAVDIWHNKRNSETELSVTLVLRGDTVTGTITPDYTPCQPMKFEFKRLPAKKEPKKQVQPTPEKLRS